jgi:hypothetical protein
MAKSASASSTKGGFHTVSLVQSPEDLFELSAWLY